MGQIKEIKTEKFEGLAVLVPDGTANYELKYYKYSDGKEYHSINYSFSERHTGGFLLWYKDFGGRKNYPKEGELVLLGKATELTEEQCTEIVDKGQSYGYYDYYSEFVAGLTFWDKASLSFASLMRSLQANTGTWLILRKL